MPHKALWINEDTTQEIKEVEGNYKPGPDELLLKSISVGLNPGDWKYLPSSPLFCYYCRRFGEGTGLMIDMRGILER
jgi:hypothetical protein